MEPQGNNTAKCGILSLNEEKRKCKNNIKRDCCDNVTMPALQLMEQFSYKGVRSGGGEAAWGWLDKQNTVVLNRRYT